MSFSLGVYDILANLVPGTFYLCITYLVLYRVTYIKIDVAEMTLGHIVLLGIFAYATGLIIDPLAKLLWYERFHKSSQSRIVATLNAQNDAVKFSTRKYSWSLLSYYVLHHSPNLHQRLLRLGGITILLRNASFALVIVFLLSIIDALVFNLGVWQIVVGVSSFIASMLALKGAIVFDKRRFQGLYQAIAALELKKTSLPTNLGKKRKSSKEEEDDE